MPPESPGQGQPLTPAELAMKIEDISTGPPPQGDVGEGLRFRTSRGEINSILHRAPDAAQGVVWVCGARGGFGGPGPGIYEHMAEEFLSRKITSLRLDYRLPNDLSECALDLLTGVAGLKGLGCGPVVVVGHSFGGAVVIAAAAASPYISGVVSLSPQTYGANGAPLIAPRPLLLVHGKADTRLPYSCAVQIHQMAQEPKTLVLYEGAEHRLEECRDELQDLLGEWIPSTLAAAV
jgi:pimeloyl-ACP methyl ester carboxylesterase